MRIATAADILTDDRTFQPWTLTVFGTLCMVCDINSSIDHENSTGHCWSDIYVARVDIFVWSLDIFVRGEDIFVTTVCRIWRWSEMRRPHAAAVTPASLCLYVSLGPWSLQTSVWLTKYFPTQLHMSGRCFHVAICPRPASCSWTNNWFAHLRCGDYVLVSPSAWQCHTLRDITTCIRDRPEFLPHLATAAPLSVMVPVSRVSRTRPTLETWSPVNTDKRCSRFPGV